MVEDFRKTAAVVFGGFVMLAGVVMFSKKTDFDWVGTDFDWASLPLTNLSVTIPGFDYSGMAPEFHYPCLKHLSHVKKHYGCTMPTNMEVFAPHNHSEEGKFILCLLRSSKPVTWVRYGDGEWMCVKGQTFKNIDHQESHPDMCKELHRLTVATAEKPMANLQMFLTHFVCDRQFLQYLPMLGPLGHWTASWGLLPFLAEAPLIEMMAAVCERPRVVLVAPIFLGNLRKVFCHSDHIIVPNKRQCHDKVDTWGKHAEIEKRIRELSSAAGDEPITFLVAGGMAAKVIILRVVGNLGHKDSFIDIGSTFDVFTGYWRGGILSKFHKLMAKNGNITEYYPWFNETQVC